MAPAAVFPFLWTGFLVSAVSATTKCTWNLGIISTQSYEVASDKPVIRDTSPLWNITFMITEQETTDLHHIDKELYYAYPYSLKLEIVCDDEHLTSLISRFYTTSGGRPFVQMCTAPDGPESLVPVCYTFEAELVDNSTLSGEDSGSCSEFWLCSPAWILPLPVDGKSSMINGYVNSWTSGPLVDSKRFTVSVDGYYSVQKSPSPFPTPPEQNIGTMHHKSPTIILRTSGSKFITSSDGFGSLSLKELLETDLTTYGSVKCGCLTGLMAVHSVASLSDRFIFLTKVGILEMIGDFTYLDKTDTSSLSTLPRLVWPHCARHVSLPSNSDSPQQYTLVSGACDKHGTAYVTKHNPRYSTALSFREVIDDNGKTVCGVLEDSTQCDIVAMGSSGGDQGTWFFLLDVTFINMSSYYILNSYKAGSQNGDWQLKARLEVMVPSSPGGARPVMLSLVSSPDSSLTLSGMTLAPWVSQHIYLWGNYILHSPDGGSEFYLLPWTFTGNVSLFVTGGNGYVAFYTTSEELWASVVGGQTAWILYPSVAWDMTLQAQGLDSPFSLSTTLISIFFDNVDKLQLIIWDGSQILRHTVPLESILAKKSLETIWDYSNGDVYSKADTSDIRDFQLVDRCPFSQILLDVPKNQKYSKLQEIHFSSPHQTGNSMTHSNASFLTYHLVTQNLVYHIMNFNNSYADSYTDSVARWRDALNHLHTYKQYLFQNSYLLHDVHINPWDYKREYLTEEFPFPTLPKTVYLGRFENYTFSIILFARESDGSGAFNELRRLQMSAQVSNPNLVKVSVTSETFYINDTVKYEVMIRDMGIHEVQSAPGINMYPTALELTILNAPLECFEKIGDEIQHQGMYHTTVLLGCPPSQRVMFDWHSFARMQESDIQEFPWDCVVVNSDMPCFYYSNGFYPYFVVLDDATGHSEQFKGEYMLRVIGNVDGDSVHLFTTDEIRSYNNLNMDGGPSLIFGPMKTVEDVDGWPVYNHTNNMISWFCQPGSPCSNIYPIIPRAPEYYFLIEFTNRDLTRNMTNCDYTMSFVVHVHGLPIDPLRTSLMFVVVSILLLCVYVALYYLCHKSDGKMISLSMDLLHQMMLPLMTFLRTCQNRHDDDDDDGDGGDDGPASQGAPDQEEPVLRKMVPQMTDFQVTSHLTKLEEEEESSQDDDSSLANENNSASDELPIQPSQHGHVMDDIKESKRHMASLRKPIQTAAGSQSIDRTDEEFLEYLGGKAAWQAGSSPSKQAPSITGQTSQQASLPNQTHGAATGKLDPSFTQPREALNIPSKPLKTPGKHVDRFIQKSLATPSSSWTKLQRTPTSGPSTTPLHNILHTPGYGKKTDKEQSPPVGGTIENSGESHPANTAVSEEEVDIVLNNAEVSELSPGSTKSLDDASSANDPKQRPN